MYGELSSGWRRRGIHALRFKDCLTRDLVAMHKPLERSETAQRGTMRTCGGTVNRTCLQRRQEKRARTVHCGYSDLRYFVDC